MLLYLSRIEVYSVFELTVNTTRMIVAIFQEAMNTILFYIVIEKNTKGKPYIYLRAAYTKYSKSLPRYRSLLEVANIFFHLGCY